MKSVSKNQGSRANGESSFDSYQTNIPTRRSGSRLKHREYSYLALLGLLSIGIIWCSTISFFLVVHGEHQRHGPNRHFWLRFCWRREINLQSHLNLITIEIQLFPPVYLFVCPEILYTLDTVVKLNDDLAIIYHHAVQGGAKAIACVPIKSLKQNT